MFSNKHTIPHALSGSDLAAAVSSTELATLDRLATTIQVSAGERIVQVDGFGRECFVVIEGQFEVERDGMTILVGPGSVIGEMALLTLEPRTASVTATTDSTVYVLTRAEFASLLAACPNIARYVLDGAARRAVAAYAPRQQPVDTPRATTQRPAHQN